MIWSRLGAAIVCATMIAPDVAALAPQPSGAFTNVESIVRQSHRRRTPIVVRLSSGKGYRGVVSALDEDGFDLIETSTRSSRRIAYSQVSAAAPSRNNRDGLAS